MKEKTGKFPDPIEYARQIGYSLEEMRSVPEEVTTTHGCGNPTSLAELKEGQVVLDLGCGGGLDVFLAAQKVGPAGKVIGLDVSSEKIKSAADIAKKRGYKNVEFKVAQMEKLPFPDGSIDIAISNCVINHSSDKTGVFREIHRILKPGGRMFVSDLVTTVKFTEQALKKIDKLWKDWLVTASGKQEYLNAIKKAGFQMMTVLTEDAFPMAEEDILLKGKIISLQIKGVK